MKLQKLAADSQLIDDPVYKHIYHTEIENTLNIYFRNLM